MALKICPSEWPEKPWPDRARVVRPVTSCRIALVPPAVFWIQWRQAAKAEWSEEVPLDSLDYPYCAFRRYHFVKKAHCENLIGTYRAVPDVAIDNVVETISRWIPKQLFKTGRGPLCEISKTGRCTP